LKEVDFDRIISVDQFESFVELFDSPIRITKII